MRIKHLIPACFLLIAGCTATRSTTDDNLDKSTPNFLFLSDIHLDTTESTRYGDDTGLQLWNNFLQKADAVLAGPNPPKFVLYTGDLPAHYSCRSDCELKPDSPVTNTHNHNLTVILTGLRNLVAKHKVPFFYLPGNNDAIAGNYFSFSNASLQNAFGLVPDPANPYPALNIKGDSATAPCILSQAHIKKGYYAARPLPGLRLICMNTIIYSRKYTVVDGGTVEGDRNDEMKWLQQELDEAAVAAACRFLHLVAAVQLVREGRELDGHGAAVVDQRLLHEPGGDDDAVVAAVEALDDLGRDQRFLPEEDGHRGLAVAALVLHRRPGVVQAQHRAGAEGL